MTFGDYIRIKRKAINLSREALALAAGITPEYVEYLESNQVLDSHGRQRRPNLEIVDAIARALGVPVNEARSMVHKHTPSDYIPETELLRQIMCYVNCYPLETRRTFLEVVESVGKLDRERWSTHPALVYPSDPGWSEPVFTADSPKKLWGTDEDIPEGDLGRVILSRLKYLSVNSQKILLALAQDTLESFAHIRDPQRFQPQNLNRNVYQFGASPVTNEQDILTDEDDVS